MVSGDWWVTGESRERRQGKGKGNAESHRTPPPLSICQPSTHSREPRPDSPSTAELSQRRLAGVAITVRTAKAVRIGPDVGLH